ncbi:MAG: TIGR02270 family protein [Gammaproteobacteria bacterium]|nr:TIGR02270 family protein [Gammaproteobacteria bacterium]
MMTALDTQDAPNIKHAYKDFYEHSIEDASFLWILRSVAIEQPHYTAHDIRALEHRIAARLDGLMTALDPGWAACEAALEFQAPGEVFAAMVTAMRSHDSGKIKTAVDTGLENALATPGLISAMGWLPDALVNPWTKRFLNGKEMAHKYLGLTTCSVRRQNPGEHLTHILQRDDCQQHEKLYCRALRLIGELRRQDAMPAIYQAIHNDNDNIRFWATWSAVLLGHRASAHALQDFVFSAGPHQHQAIQLAFRALPVEQAREWIDTLSDDKNQTRAVIKATGALGDPHAINWLINTMRDPTSAKLAGESFTTITGIDLKAHRLTLDAPDDTITIDDIDDTDNDNLDLDDDENLPVPDAEKVAALWCQQSPHYIIGQRYFMGQPIGAKHLKTVLADGTQRQRHAAALELALNERDVPLPNTRARMLTP